MNVIFTCGGTAGHINPAIAVANIFKERHPDCNILFIGASGHMEEKLVPQAGYELKILKDTANGYEIAQADLEMRGAGDFITGTGVRQSGQSMFRLAANCRDTDFMEHTACLAKELIGEDPELTGWPALREKVDRIRYAGSHMEN